jgi:hypothetical protein
LDARINTIKAENLMLVRILRPNTPSLDYSDITRDYYIPQYGKVRHNTLVHTNRSVLFYLDLFQLNYVEVDEEPFFSSSFSKAFD